MMLVNLLLLLRLFSTATRYPFTMSDPEQAQEMSRDGSSNAKYYDTDFQWIGNKSVRKGVTTVYPYAHRVYLGMEWLGGKIADGLGITQSRFQYAVDEYNRRERRKRDKEALERERMLQRARELGEEDEEPMPYAPPVLLEEHPVTSIMAPSSSTQLAKHDEL